ncbi:MAG: cysteine desulfurase family protein [Agromyces sp.]
MIYLDHAATSPPRAEALHAMWPQLTTEFGNPSSVHERGRAAADALERARTVIAELTGFRADDVVFTSGGTESDNLAIAGLALGRPRGRHIVSARTEHEAVLQSLAWLERWHGFSVSWVTPEPDGRITAAAVRRELRSDSTLVSIMRVNNEIGTLNPIAEIAAAAHELGALVHSDAVQAVGWSDVRTLGVDALSLSGHKIGAPQGIGALCVRSGLPLEPTVWGGGQQRGRRSGTEPVALAVALASALAFAERDRQLGASEQLAELRDALIAGVRDVAPHAQLTGPERERAAHIASFVFPGVNGEAVLLGLEERGVTCSSGSACAAGRTDPSHVLMALGFPESLARTAVRFSLGRETSAADIERTIAALDDTLRELSRYASPSS